MTEEIYRLFKRNLPYIERGEETVKQILSDPENHLILHKVGETLAGVSVINDSTVYLLCVDEPFQRQGIGSSLLARSEEYAASKGVKKLTLGTGKEYIMPGVPMNEGAHEFFKKRGYRHSWGDMGCFDMEQLLEDFPCMDHFLGETRNGVTYRLAVPEDLERVVRCVSDAEPKFLRFYRNENFYQKDTQRPIVMAERDGEVLGAILLYIGREENMGSVGATATAHPYRNQGIATNLVKVGTKHLKDLGLKRACLGYTYTQIVKMYGKAGYRVSVEYFMGEKDLTVRREENGMDFQKKDGRIYAESEGKLLAEITFPDTAEGIRDIDHTFVDESLRGQGIAGELVRMAAESIIAEGKKAKASCSYAAKWLEKHPEYGKQLQRQPEKN